MNPVVYNKNGQFRFTDFIGYLPEFLRSEPDVVTYLQVMSDYINNAYRNIDVTDEFEIVKVCTSSDSTVVMNWMNRLCEMFKIASDRGDTVMYLSVPRNNIKSNVILGNSTAEYVRKIEIDLDEIQDVIKSATRRLGGTEGINDGDIVYVKYRTMNPVQTVAYYFSADTDTLVKDCMATSQDPFTDTYNDPQMAIQFNVVDVDKVIRRYGYKSEKDNIVYYEVYFTVHIANLQKVPAVGTVLHDVDGDSEDDTIYVDYYNMGGATGNTYNTYIKFAEAGGFNWVGGYPSGLFYFRDSSTAKLTNLSDSNSMMLSDTLLSPSVDQYPVRRIEKMNGVYRVYFDAFPGIYADALFYISRVNQSLGVYKMFNGVHENGRFDEGELYIDLVNVSGIDYDIEHLDHLLLTSIPLAQSKYVIDYEDSLPVVRWDSEILGLDGVQIGISNNISMRSVEVTNNNILYNGRIEWAGTTRIMVNQDVSKDIYPGMIIASDAFAFDGGINMPCAGLVDTPYIGIVDRCFSQNGKYYIDLKSGTKIDLGTIAANSHVSITDVSSGYILCPASEYNADGADLVYFHAVWDENNVPKVGDKVVVSMVDSGSHNVIDRMLTVGAVNAEQRIIAFNTVDGFDFSDRISPMTPLRRLRELGGDRKGAIYAFDYVRRGPNGVVIAAAKRDSYEGDIFTTFYMLAKIQKTKETVLLHMVTDVYRKEDIVVASEGMYVYDAPYVYRVVKEYDTNTYNNSVVRDRIAHYSVGLTKLTNSYMPYCGPVTQLSYDESPAYGGDMSTVRLPLYIKKIHDVRLKYGWEQRQYVHYNDNIGVAARERSGFVEFFAGTVRSPVDFNLTKSAHRLPKTSMLYGCGSQYYVLDVDAAPVAQRDSDGNWCVTVRSGGHNLPNGVCISATVQNESEQNVKVFSTENSKVNVVSPDVFQYTVISNESDDVGGLIHQIANVDNITIRYDREYIGEDGVYPQDGDIVVLTDKVSVDGADTYVDIMPPYKVSTGTWSTIDPTSIVVPATIYSRHNLFDESLTNPTFALSQGYTIKEITADADTATIRVSGRISEFDRDDAADIFDDSGRVYINFVNQGVFNGWHTIKHVYNGGLFEVYIDSSIPVDPLIMPITNRKMTVFLGQWYKYTLYGYDWDKKSNLTSYVTTNMIVSNEQVDIGPDDYVLRIKTKYKHNLKTGDHVLIDSMQDGSSVYTGAFENISQTTIRRVIDEYTVELTDHVVGCGTIYRGFLIDNMNLVRLNGEYSISVGDSIISFKAGDVVIPTKQVCLDERRGWKVCANTSWVPMAAKRTFKIDKIAVDLKRNPAYDSADSDDDSIAEYEYVTYSDCDVLADSQALLVDYANARNYHFEHAHVDNLDTTQNIDLEYSSKYDYATVAPREGMDPSFKGVPDMGYPLAERIERLAYLRDPEVIDIDLIGYLARFMGYDITAVADDIKSSNLYRNSEEREAAVRAALARLPQFYALSGTKPGISMLMATFGLVGNLVTMWTNTANPYKKLVRQDEVNSYIDADVAAGKTVGTWVPTPHVTLDVMESDNFNSLLLGNEELVRMKEQIRRCKPIHVVFDGICVVFNDLVNVDVSIVEGPSSIEDTTASLIVVDEGTDIEITEDPCVSEDCDF